MHVLADQQRHELGGSTASTTRAQLCAITGVSSGTLTKITHALIAAEVLDVQRPVGPSGPLPSVYRLIGDPNGPRILITHPTLRVMRTELAGARLTGAFATYVTIADLINERRGESVVASRQELARRVGVSSPRSLDEYVSALESAALLRKHAVCDHRGQRPVTWELVEPGAAPLGEQSAPGEVIAAAQSANGATANDAPAQCTLPPDPVQSVHTPTASSEPTLRNPKLGPNAKRTGSGDPAASPITGASENSQDVEHQDSLVPPNELPDVARGGGESCPGAIEIHVENADRLIDVFAAWTREALGDRRAAAVYDAATWRRAATTLLEQYDLERILGGIERLTRDPLLADKATTLPAFAQIADRAIARAAADRGLATHRDTTTATAAGTGRQPVSAPSWASAQTLLRQAISAFGGGGEERALAFLEDKDALLADKATTLPAFAQIADRAIARAAADRALAEHRAASTSATGAPAWASAHALLRQAVSAFGRGGENRALAFLEEQEPFVAAFARDVGWRTLARSDDSMNDIKFAYLTFRHSSATPEAA